MTYPPQVATGVSVGTKVAVAVLLLAGLGALGYASGYVKLDYQQSSATADQAAEECDCLYECAMERIKCLEKGGTEEDCNAKIGVCVEECFLKEDPVEECKDECKVIFSECKMAGGTNEECAEKTTTCLCECDPWFEPVSIDNSCSDQCRHDRERCEANSNSAAGQSDCAAIEESCLFDCTPWCDERDSSDDQDDGEKLPDLLVSDIGIAENGVLTIKMENQGTDVDTTSGHTYVYIDGNLEWTYSWSTLNDQIFLTSGGSSLLQPQYLKDFLSVKACVDANDVVKESDETNNCKDQSRDADDQDDPDDSSGPEDDDLVCEDTDNGFKPYDYGVASTATITGKDVCVIVSDTAMVDGKLVVTGDVQSEVEECDPNVNEKCFLDEYMCENNNVKHGYHKCESYCYQGECMENDDSQGGSPTPVTDPPEVNTPDVVESGSSTLPGTSIIGTDINRF